MLRGAGLLEETYRQLASTVITRAKSLISAKALRTTMGRSQPIESTPSSSDSLRKETPKSRSSSIA